MYFTKLMNKNTSYGFQRDMPFYCDVHTSQTSKAVKIWNMHSDICLTAQGEKRWLWNAGEYITLIWSKTVAEIGHKVHCLFPFWRKPWHLTTSYNSQIKPPIQSICSTNVFIKTVPYTVGLGS